MKFSPVIILFSLCLAVIFPAVGSGELGVIELKHRTADEIIPILRPFLESGDTLSGQKYVIFVSTDPDTLARLRSIVLQLDKAPRQLIIVVVQGENAQKALASVDLSGNISIDDSARLTFGRNPQPDDTIALTGRSRQYLQSDVEIQQVRAQEGMATTLFFGQSIPLATRSTAPHPYGAQSENGAERNSPASRGIKRRRGRHSWVFGLHLLCGCDARTHTRCDRVRAKCGEHDRGHME